MKNKFFTILLTAAVGISSVFSTGIQAAAKSYLYISKKPVSKKTIYVGNEGIRLKYNINGRTKGIKGSWKSDNSKKVKVNKNGVCTAVGNGKTTVSFNYSYGGKKYSLKCKLTVETKAGEVSLLNANKNTDEITLETGAEHEFKSKIIPAEEALEANSRIKSTDKVFYQLFEDEDCTRVSELGEISTDGLFTAGDKPGTLYVRASAKKKKTSPDDIISDVIKITIEEAKKQEEPKQEKPQKEEPKAEEPKKEDNKPAQTADKSKPAKIEISSNAILTDANPKNGLYFANAYFKIFDGNGKEITNSPEIMANRFTATWNGNAISVVESGKITLIFAANMPTVPTPIGTSGELKISYKDVGNNEIAATQTIRIAPPSFINSVELKGIYRCVYSTTSSSVVYESVLDKDTIRLKSGDVIADFGSSLMLNNVPNSYYLLLKATDSFGNNIAEAGIKETRLNVDITGSAIVSVDTVLENGVETKESIRPVIVDGVSYLTYPLKAGKVASGDLNITIQGGVVRQVINKRITDGSVLKGFYLTGTATYLGEDNIVPYFLYTSMGGDIKEYGAVLYYLGLTDQFNTGIVNLPFDSKIISSSKGSSFVIKRNATTGEAEIHYTPNSNVLINGNTVMDFGIDEITLLKDYGSELERKIPISVNKKRQ